MPDLLKSLKDLIFKVNVNLDENGHNVSSCEAKCCGRINTVAFLRLD